MQNTIRTFVLGLAIVFSLACVYQLSFTWVANGVEEDAVDYAADYDESQREAKEINYLDSINNEVVYNFLAIKAIGFEGLKPYTYNDCKKKRLNLGLDLKGGMNVTLEVMVVDVIKALSNNSKDAVFNLAITNALKEQEDSQDDFVSLFGQEYEKLSPSNGMAVLFISQLKTRLKVNSTNEEVIAVLREEVEGAISNSFDILRSRIDRFGVTQPNIQELDGGRILVELPGIKDPARARKLLQSTAKLEFWETYECSELSEYLELANTYLRETVETTLDDAVIAEETIESNLQTSELNQTLIENVEVSDSSQDVNDLRAALNQENSLGSDSVISSTTFEAFAAENPLYAVLSPNVDQEKQQWRLGPVVGFCAVKDTPTLNSYLKDAEVIKIFRDVKFAYSVKPFQDGEFIEIVALKVTNRDGKAAMEGDVVTDAKAQPTSNSGGYEVSMEMNSEGAKKWKRLTKDNIEKSIAIVLDGYVYSYPTVQSEISGGRSSITGDFNVEEAKDLSNILKSGKLPAPARIVEEAIVGPSLGEEAVNSSLISFIFALLFVLLYMIFYYNGAGVVSNIALLLNIFFIFGVLASFGSVLTLPGIAGIILTIGMSVDANVLIYERIREEMRNGKGLNLAISDGYNNAYSSIIDANVTTLLTGIILYTFGTGPIKGFAITLIFGIITSLFAAIFITRLVISARMKSKGGKISFATKITEGAFKNINFDFVGKRKRFYVFSLILILLGAGSLFTRGLHKGVDFEGGRSYVVRFDDKVDNEELRNSLANVFVDKDGLSYTPQVKTFGDNNQVKITTSLDLTSEEMTDDSDAISAKLYEGCKILLSESLFDEVAEISKRISSNSKDLAKTVNDEEAKGLLEAKEKYLAEELELAEEEIYEKFKQEYVMSSQKVGPTIADDIWQSAILSIVFSLLVIFLYLLVRFRKWQFSLGAVAAAFHDVVIVLSIFSVFYGILPFSLEIDQAFIAAILTIIGYSLNDTVVVFDRVREYLTNNKKKEVHEVINGALNSTLSRTINTSLTTFFVLLVIFIWGGEVIQGFMFALMVGVVVGTYSSLFVASPIMMDTIKSKKGNRL